jgi:Gram-negative bacterial TonB protein C-terminal
MKRVLKYLAFFLLLTVTGPLIWAQQAASMIDQSPLLQADRSSPRLTTDGAPFCSQDFESRSLPAGTYRIGGSILPPIETKAVDPTFSDEERKYAKTIMKTQHIKRFEAKSLVDLIVDTDGVPRHLCILNELGHGFDRKAFDAVAGYRFKPATRDGKPVPVHIAVEVKFALW